MPHCRMQHIAASAYTANSTASTLMKNFLQRLQKLWNETGELSLIFFSN